MKAKETKLEGCFVINPNVFNDDRGYFFESFNQESFNKLVDQEVTFVQDNESFSSRGVLRGLHFQKGEYAQAKLVRVVKGSVLDVVVDIREESGTYGQHIAVELSESNKKQLFVPRGFAHGFVVLSPTAIFFYKCDNFYNKAYEGGVVYNDPSLDIDWRFSEHKLIISDKDRVLPMLNNIKL